MLNSCLVQDLKFRLYLLLHLKLSLVQFLLEQFWWVLNQKILVDLVGLWGVSVVDNIQLFFYLLLVVRTLLEVVHDPAWGIVPVQLWQFFFNDPAFPMPGTHLVLRMATTHHHQLLHQRVVLCLLPLLQVSPKVLYELRNLTWRWHVLL